MTNKHSLRNVRSLACAMLLTTGSLLPLGAQKTNNAPTPILPLPEQRQVDWQKMETYAFIHFGLNTFNDREWGYGDTPAETFNPTRLDCNQWVATLKAAGMKGVIFTAKHHDGFCLWPFKGTDYNVAHSPFRDGKGDVVRELQEACKKQGMKFAVYISPWDRNRADYGTPAYLDYYYAQIRDLLSNYGEVFEIWFDGANGGDGWYGGANDRRTIDRRTYYKFENIQALCDSLQPKAVMFSDGGPGCRWVGNERGIAGATNWAFLRKNTVYPGYPKHYELQYGHADGDQWTPSECDVSIRPGWFYHAQQDNQVKSPQQLADIYYRSVGHNGTMLLNFPVNRDGLIHSIDSTNAVKFREIIDNDFKTNLIAGMKAKATNTRGKRFSTAAMTDNDYDTYWATADGTNTATVTYQFRQPQRMNRMMLQEYIPLGQRVKSFVVEYQDGKQWLPVSLNEETTTIGYKRLLRFKSVTSKGIRVRFTDSRGPLCINNLSVYDAGENADQVLPSTSQIATTLPYSFINQEADKAKAAADRNERTNCFIDGDELVIDLGQERTISSFHYLPDQSEQPKGLISHYELTAISAPSDKEEKMISQGEFSNIRNNPTLQSLFFTPVITRYIRLKATRMINAGEPMGFAEIAIH